MSADITHHTLRVRCRCESFALAISDAHPAAANRIACHCAGCVAFAHRMDASALDRWGGVERFQVRPGSITVLHGAEHLACMQQTPKGALRWVAACCGTPIGLTLRTARVPFVGLDVVRIDTRELQVPLEAAIGPIRARVNSGLRGEEAAELKATTAALFSMLGHLAPLTLHWWWEGEQKRSPFFEAGQPVAAVQHLYTELPTRVARGGCR